MEVFLLVNFTYSPEIVHLLFIQTYIMNEIVNDYFYFLRRFGKTVKGKRKSIKSWEHSSFIQLTRHS